MPEFLTTNKIIYHLEKIIQESKNEITLVSPYLRLSQNIFNRLSEADDQGKTINFVYGKKEITNDQKELIGRLKNTNLFYSEKLHAKCYFNESAAILTSMNLYEFSERDNLEMGFLVECTGDAILYSEIVNEVRTIVKNGKKIKESNKNSYLVNKTMSEQFYDYFSKKYPDNGLYFQPAPGPIDNAILIVKINESPYFHISLNLDYRIEIDTKSYSKKMMEKLFLEFNRDEFKNNYRFFWDTYKDMLTIYKSVRMRDSWNSVDVVTQFDYFAEALFLLVNELKRAYAKIKEKEEQNS